MSPSTPAQSPYAGVQARLIFVILLALSPAFVLVAYNAQQGRAQSALLIQARTFRLAQDVAAAQSHLIDRTRDLLDFLSHSPVVTESAQDCHNALHTVLAEHPRLMNLVLFDRAGKAVCSALKPTGPVDASHRMYFRRVLQRKTFAVGDYEIGQITHKPVLVGAVPLLDPARHVQSVLVGAMKLDWTGKLTKNAHFPKGAVFMLLDSNNRVLARYPGTGSAVGKHAPQAAFLKGVKSRPGGYAQEHFVHRGNQLLVYTPVQAQLGAGDLRALLAVPADAAFAKVNAMTAHWLEWLTLLGVAAGLTAWFGSKWVVITPVLRLVHAARRVGGGDFSARVGFIGRARELMHLGSAFDAMAAALEQREHKINYLSFWDPLTNLPNRAAFLNRLDKITDAGESDHPLTVMVISIAALGSINWEAGYHVGDHIVQYLGQRLRDDYLATDDINAARVDVDRFALRFDGIRDLATITDIASGLRQRLEGAIEAGEETANIRVHIGAATYPEQARNSLDLLQNATLAAHSASNEPGQEVRFYSKDIAAHVRQRRDLEAALHTALDRREFFLYYQAQFDALSGKLRGAEALIRWDNPQLGQVPPDQFIPILEELGLIGSVGEWVLDAASRQLAAWSGHVEPGFVMSVNVSSHQLRTHGFRKRAVDIVTHAGVEPRQIELEITETGLMDRAASTLARLAALKEAGFRLAVDDFGTGYSSLSYLQHFPLDTLKIDRLFVRDMHRSTSCMSIIRAVVAMAHTMGLDVVAEGVEDEDQLSLLIAEGCHYIQGYYFSRPVPAEQFLDLAQ
ncbi:MAG: EAL domain-containing protein [Gammaproteobacteria bacterium]